MENKRGKHFKVKSIHKLARNSRVTGIDIGLFGIKGIYYCGNRYVNYEMIKMCDKNFVCKYDRRFEQGYRPSIDYAYDISCWAWLEDWVTEV